MRQLFILVTLAGLGLPMAAADGVASGRALMEQVQARHEQYPYVYEEQSMILIDPSGQKTTRRLRRYSRVEADGNVYFLLLFDSPRDVAGVAMLARQLPNGSVSQSFYLPAFGDTFFRTEADRNQASENFLGTDFSVEELIGEDLERYRYERSDDYMIDDVAYYVINVFPRDEETGNPVRRHYVRTDNLFIARTEHFDDLGRVRKRQTHHDLENVHGNRWRANMMMMENLIRDHRSVIKINRRIYSADYVPMEVFDPGWIRANGATHTPPGLEARASGNVIDTDVPDDLPGNAATATDPTDAGEAP